MKNIEDINDPTKNVVDDTKPDVIAEEGFHKIRSHIPSNTNSLSVSVSRDIMIFVSDKDDFNRIDLAQDNPEEELHLERETPQPWESGSVWMEPRGRHAIIALGKETFFYNYALHTFNKPTKFKPSNLTLPKVTAVAWDEESEGNYDVFLGCANGVIYHTTVSAEAPFRETSNFTELGSLEVPIANILIIKRASVRIVLIATFERFCLKMWSGNWPARNLLEKVEPGSGTLLKENKKTPEGLSVLRSYENLGKCTIGWLTDTGLLYCEFSKTEEIAQKTNFYQFIDFPKPVSFVMTAHHIFFLYPKSIVGVSRLLLQHTNSLKQSEDWQHNLKSPANGIVEDQFHTNKFWIYHSNPKISNLTINNETQNLWYIHFQTGNYEDALKLNIPNERKQMIYEKQIERYEKEKSYKKLAIVLADSTVKSFSESCLKFIHLKETDALIEYLKTKLTNPDLRFVHAARRTILATWLLEVYLKRMDEISMRSRKGGLGEEQKMPEWVEVKEATSTFLRDKKEDLEKAEAIVFQLLSTYNQDDLIIEWTELLSSNHEKLIERCLQRRDYNRIFDFLRNGGFNLNILYEQGPILMHHNPTKTFELMKNAEGLDLEKLIPTLMRCGTFDQQDPVINYLETSIKRSKNPVPSSIHNLLFTRYANWNSEKLEEYIERPTSNFTLEYGLRFCLLKKALTRSAALIYAKMEMYDEAIDKALELALPESAKTTSLPTTFESGLSLATKIAKKPSDIEKKKQLMKQIVECLISNNNIFSALNNKLIQSATETVQQNSDLLSIEDIIKDLPDEMLIKDIKNELCQSVTQSNQKIAELRKKMERTKKTKERITEEIHKRQQKVTIPDTTVCAISKVTVKPKQFSHFRDGSTFMNQKLIAEAKNYPVYKELQEALVGQENEEKRQKIAAQIKKMELQTNPFYADHFIDSIDADFKTGDF